MISYTHHILHMRQAASRIEHPQGTLYKQIAKFIKDLKKRKKNASCGLGTSAVIHVYGQICQGASIL